MCIYIYLNVFQYDITLSRLPFFSHFKKWFILGKVLWNWFYIDKHFTIYVLIIYIWNISGEIVSRKKYHKT